MPLQRGFDLPTTSVVSGSIPVVYSNGVGRHHNKAMAKGPGVVTGRSGTIGRVHYVESDFWPHNTALWVTDFKHCHPKFTYYFLQYVGLERFAGGSGVPTLNRNDVHSFEITIPESLNEQHQIAKALTDTDDLIAILERVIAKKQEIKQGIMQQLLTGESRLPGFNDFWRKVCLRDAGYTYGGLTGKTKDDFGTGMGLFVTFMEVMASPRLLGQRLERVKVRPNERQSLVRRNDVLFNGSSETQDEVALSAVVDFEPSGRIFLNSFCFGYRLKRSDLIDPAYLAYFFRSGAGRVLVASLAQGATRYNIAKTKFLELSLVLPPLDEQHAIVTTLRDCEDEITAVTQRLIKAQDVKQGMVQQLLTGRTRLPVTEVAA